MPIMSIYEDTVETIAVRGTSSSPQSKNKSIKTRLASTAGEIVLLRQKER